MPLFRRRWLIACEMDLQNHPVFAPKDRRIPFGGRRRRKSGETLRTLRRWKKAEHRQGKKDARIPSICRRQPRKVRGAGVYGILN